MSLFLENLLLDFPAEIYIFHERLFFLAAHKFKSCFNSRHSETRDETGL